MIYGIGMDVVENERFKQSIERLGEAFLNKIFTEKEKQYCGVMKFADRHYAARFAAKEAIAKAFGTGIGAELGWLDMEILRRDTGAPYVVLSGNGEAFAARQAISRVLVSLTHSDHYSAANAVAICDHERD